jgi:hypothetical protein
MKTVFGLWDSATNNLVADFDSEFEALAYVVEEMEIRGHDAVMTWGLLRDEGQKTALIAAGRDLAEYARTTPLRTA